jgi:hypothetical protein
MKLIFFFAIVIFLYLPAIWFTNHIQNGRDFIDLSPLELIGAIFVHTMPIVLLCLIEKRQATD